MVSNSGNNYTGDTTIYNQDYNGTYTGNSTTLKLGNASAIPSGANAGNVVFTGADANHLTILDLGGFSPTVNGLSAVAAAGAEIVNSGSAGTLSIGADNSDSTFSGQIAGGANVALALVGTGTVQLSGSNTFSGGNYVNAGVLQLGSSAALLNSNPTVAAGATLDVFGNSMGTATTVTISGTGAAGAGGAADQ